eukprot:Phypoly_transcript_02319.p1 GENE.Phypoly_transcript_02319~~Phypoly_transcript_02319.p1  ORF type:complete len:586 (+),score=106.00 Phypoly_transcript_02319:93-1850(+)
MSIPAHLHHAPPITLAYIFVVEDGPDHTKETSLEDLFLNKQFTDNLQYHSAALKCFHDNPNVKRYTRFHLRGTLKLMGCKSAESQKISDRVFRSFEKDYLAKQGIPRSSPTVASRRHSGSLSRKISSPNFSAPPAHASHTHSAPPSATQSPAYPPAHPHVTFTSPNSATSSPHSASHPDPLGVTIKRSEFFTIMRYALHIQDYNEPRHLTDFPIACDVQDRKYSFTILLGGTSGCGKSTLAALLASRIGFSSVISTDNIRQLMRKFISRAEAPILWASTYHAGEILDGDSSLSHKERILKGYEAQNEMIFKQLDALIGTYEEKKDSLIIEGVHLDTRLIMRLVKRHPTCIPFLMHISNEAKHRERFAIRSKYMTLDPRQNKYTKFFKNIRIINDYLCSGADVKMIPQIDNTNMDRSLATIHATIFNCLRRHVLNGESYYDPVQDNLLVVHEEFEANKHTLWSSKGMLRVIRDKRGKVKTVKEKKIEDEEDEEYEEEDEEEEEESAEESAREPVISGQVGDPGFNSDDESEDEDDKSAKPTDTALAQPGSTPSAEPTEEDSEGETSDDTDDDTKSEYFMDCGSLGS